MTLIDVDLILTIALNLNGNVIFVRHVTDTLCEHCTEYRFKLYEGNTA